MPDTLEDGITWGEADDIDMEDARRTEWGEVIGDRLEEINGITSKRPRDVNFGFTNTATVVAY